MGAKRYLHHSDEALASRTERGRGCTKPAEQRLATKPDVLEATVARTQYDYDLQAAIGAEDIAPGHLATVLGLPPGTTFEVQEIKELARGRNLSGGPSKP